VNFDRNIAAFDSALPGLLKSIPGRWVLIHSGELCGDFPDFAGALSNGYKRFGIAGGWLVQEVKPAPARERWRQGRSAAESEYRSWGFV
jgi:hypothetical protein